MKNLTVIFALLLSLGVSVSAQVELTPFDAAKVPNVADRPEAFTHSGWKVEQVIKGDLNGDGNADAAIKIAQIEKGREGGIGGDRALIVAFNDGGKWKRVALSQAILQCVDCGGAFYGVMPAPADVTIEKGVIVVGNEHGSRNVDTSTYRFRYDQASGRFVLIGYDFVDNDRNTGAWVNESTNYSTNKRITKSGKGKRSTSTTAVIKPTTIYLEDADQDTLEGEALHRHGLD